MRDNGKYSDRLLIGWKELAGQREGERERGGGGERARQRERGRASQTERERERYVDLEL